MKTSTTKKLVQTLLCLFVLFLLFSIGGCGGAGKSGAARTTAESAPEERHNPIPNKIPDSSKFAKIKIGWSQKRVHDTIGDPTDSLGYTTGKAWIPYYFGGDTYRQEDLYKGEGRIVYENTGGYASHNYTVAEIIYDSNESGYNDAKH